MQQSSYYQPSGKFTVGALVVSLVCGMVAVLVLSPFYAWVVGEISWVYINIFVCLIFGLGIGGTLSSGIRKTHLRSPFMGNLLAVICGAAAIYLHWACYLALLAVETNPELNLSPVSAGMELIAAPAVLFKAIIEISRYGLWSLKGNTVNGEMLLGIWGMECLLIIGAVIYMVRKQTALPYSEACKAWMTKEALPCPLEMPADEKNLIKSLEQGSLEQLAALPFPEEPYRGLRLTAYSCEGDPDAYLTITAVKPKKKVKKGKKPELSENEIAQFLKISNAQLQELKEHLQRLEQAHPEALPA